MRKAIIIGIIALLLPIRANVEQFFRTLEVKKDDRY